MVKTIIDSFWAGVMIAISCMIYLAVDDISGFGHIFGASLFSGALLVICWFEMNLFTGKVGYIRKTKDLPRTAAILVGNLLGGLSIGTVKGILPDESLEIGRAGFASKIETTFTSWNETFFAAVVCGILIYIAVEQYRHGRYYAILLCVPAFILSGGRHCIAEFCFMIAADATTWKALVHIGLVVVGNSIGSLMLSLWEEYKHEHCRLK